MSSRLRREIRLLKLYAGGSTLALVFLTAAAFRAQSPTRPKFDEIDVERINVVEKDGRVRLVIANSERQAVTVVDGQSILPNRKRDAGLIFFNDEGDENGGMTCASIPPRPSTRHWCSSATGSTYRSGTSTILPASI